jgi:hypothetical protein
MPAFENYFSTSNEVTEVDELVLGAGCIKDHCEEEKALAVVDLKNTKVFAIIVSGAQIQYFGIQESEVPAAAKKWLIANRR